MAHDRLRQAIDYLKDNGKVHKQQDIADALGMAKSHLSDAIRGGKYFTEGFLKRFAKAYSDYINEQWLLTGEGKMEKADRHTTRPHIPADLAVVSAGFEGKAIGTVTEAECEVHPIFAQFPKYDFTIDVYGDSMEPELRNGDTIACQWLDSSDEVRADKIYVVDSAEGAVVKQLDRLGHELVCHSINPAYDDFTIASDNVLRIARVVGVLRVF